MAWECQDANKAMQECYKAKYVHFYLTLHIVSMPKMDTHTHTHTHTRSMTDADFEKQRGIFLVDKARYLERLFKQDDEKAEKLAHAASK